MTANTLVICLHLLFKPDLCTCSDILTVTLIEMWVGILGRGDENVFWNVWKECVMTGWSWFWMASDGGGGADDIWFAWHCPVPSSILHQSSVTIQPRKKVQHTWIMSELESLTQKEGNKKIDFIIIRCHRGSCVGTLMMLLVLIGTQSTQKKKLEQQL